MCFGFLERSTALVCNNLIWINLFKNGPIKICGRQPLKKFTCPFLNIWTYFILDYPILIFSIYYELKCFMWLCCYMTITICISRSFCFDWTTFNWKFDLVEISLKSDKENSVGAFNNSQSLKICLAKMF